MMVRGLTLLCVVLLSGCPSGTSGAQGDPGPAGPPGPMGAPGSQGEAGATGAQGAAGAPGPQGPGGAVGPQGPAGAVGPQGPAGAVGPQGLVGPPGMVLVLDGGVVTGPAGASVVVTTLAASTECPTGGVRITQLSDGGLTTVCNGTPGLPPSVRTLATMSPQCPAGGVLLGTPDGGAVAVCNGTVGLQGAAGATGPVGPAGPQGVAGPQGAIGPVGPAGVAGPVGAVGPAGAAGPQGAIGPAGPAGVAGPAGPVGGVGPAGAPGAVGPAGPVGPAGSVLFLDGGVALVTEVPVQFIGFTVATFTGNLGGLPGAAVKCSAEFANSYFCTIPDYDNANTTAVPPTAAGAWYDNSRADNGTRSTSSCTDANTPWTNAATPFQTFGPTLGATGYASTTLCSNARHLACCRGGRPSTFRGFTTATYSGNLGGVPGANARCQVDFPNSWLCSLNEYDLANTPVVPPTSAGAWIDNNRAANGARSNSACTGGNTPWTNAATPFQTFGPTLSATGYAGTTLCSSLRHLACCSR